MRPEKKKERKGIVRGKESHTGIRQTAACVLVLIIIVFSFLVFHSVGTVHDVKFCSRLKKYVLSLAGSLANSHPAGRATLFIPISVLVLCFLEKCIHCTHFSRCYFPIFFATCYRCLIFSFFGRVFIEISLRYR